MEVFGSATINSLDDSRPSCRPLYRAVCCTASRVMAAGQGYFSTAARFLHAAKIPLFASKSNHMIGLETFCCVTNLELLFSFELR